MGTSASARPGNLAGEDLMYFVTTKRAEYVLFCTTPSERVALALTDKHVAHLLARDSRGDDWRLLHEWDASAYPLTDFMARLRGVDEPADPQQFLEFLPPPLR